MKTILIHGLGQGVSSWDNVIEYMEITDVLCIDLVSAKKDKPLTYDILFEEVKRICHSYNEPINLIGISLGGVLALDYAIQFSEKVNSLVLINSQYKMPKFLLTLQNIIFQFIPKQKFNVNGFTKQDFISITNSMKHIDFSNQLKHLDTLTVLINGEKDKLNYKAAKEMSELLVNSKLIVIFNAEHEINTEMPRELAAVINSFVKAE